nr:MAG TPA: head to tail adaptor [Caudoviricetes sp.]
MIKRFQKDYYPTLDQLLKSAYFDGKGNKYPEVFSRGNLQLYKKDNWGFERAIYEMDKDMQEAVTRVVFGGFEFDSKNPEINRECLVRFVAQYRFYHIGKPNAPAFRQNIVKIHMSTRDLLVYAFEARLDLLKDGGQTSSHSKLNGDARSASTRMAQGNVNLDIANTTLQTPEVNALGITQSVNDTSERSEKANIDNILKYDKMINRLFGNYEKAFLGTI